jgi:ferredoxin
MLYIDPDHCVDCEACVPECPVEAIFHETNVPPQWRHYVELNADGARRYPAITEKKRL